MRLCAITGVLALALMVTATTTRATAIHVYDDGSGDAPTIQAAIDLAQPGDNIIVHAGTYIEHITMKDQVSLFGIDGAEVTFIQAPSSQNGWTPVIEASNIGATTWLYNLTIGGGDVAVGLHGTNCSMQIRENRFIDNTGPEGFQGAAIHLSGSGSPHIENNTFENNHQYTHHDYGVPGGTLYIESSGATIIARNEFRNNGDTWGSSDGGIAIQGDCTIDDNLLINCDDQDAGIAVWGGDVVVTGNIIAGSTGNSTYDQLPSTCGIWAGVSGGRIGNNTVYDNRPVYWYRPDPTPVTWAGIRVSVAAGGELLIDRNLVASNGGGGIVVLTPQRTVISCNLTWHNSGNDLQGIAPDAGHLIADPWFCDVAGDDFRVAANSPAVTDGCGVIGALTETCAPATGIDDSPAFALSLRAVPNPFNPSTTIHVSVPVPGRVTVEIYDVTGRRVRTLYDRTTNGGEFAVDWDGTDIRGARGASGVYFVRLTASQQVTTEKIVLLK